MFRCVWWFPCVVSNLAKSLRRICGDTRDEGLKQDAYSCVFAIHYLFVVSSSQDLVFHKEKYSPLSNQLIMSETVCTTIQKWIRSYSIQWISSAHGKSMAWLSKVKNVVFLPTLYRLYLSGWRHLNTVSMCCSFFPCIEPHDYIMKSFHQWNKCSLNRSGACTRLADAFAYGSLWRKSRVIWIPLASHNLCSLYFPKDFLMLKNLNIFHIDFMIQLAIY